MAQSNSDSKKSLCPLCPLWLWLRLCCVLFLFALFAGCGHAYADPATLAPSLEPTTVFAELSSTGSLTKASEQFAAALNIDPTGVRIRIKPGDCTLCSLSSRPQMASVAGISVAEGEKIMAPNDEVSFFIPNFSCTFLYDGATLIPQQCQPLPL